MTDAFFQFGFNDEPPAPKLPAPSRELHVELVPQSSWGANLRSALSKADWDKLRKQAYRKAGYRCEICGSRGPTHPVECHEVWSYNEDTETQTLVRLEALCPSCHETKHFGRAEARGYGQRAFIHLQVVNDWLPEQAQDHLEAAFQTWERRSHAHWELDLTWLEEHGVPIPEEPTSHGCAR